MIVQVALKRLDLNQAANFQEEFEAVVGASDDLILLDLSQIQFLDSSGLAAIVYCFNLFEIRESLMLCGLQPKVEQLFKLTKMDEMLNIYPDVETALVGRSK